MSKPQALVLDMLAKNSRWTVPPQFYTDWLFIREAAVAIIVLDPGHGGQQTIPNDSTWNNAVGPNGTLEKKLTLEVGLRTFTILRNLGHDVRMTRTSDVNLRLRDRAKVARDAGAQVFVSIHFNGSTGHNAQGTETLVHTNYSQRSARLSINVQDAMLQATGLTDRNRTFSPNRIKPQSLGVLRPDSHSSATAACLAEISFLDRADEEARLNTTAYLDRISQALAKGITDNVGVAVHAMPADVGDGIEAAAAESLTFADAASFLGLDTVETPASSPPKKDTADLGEKVAKPSGLFSQAFLSNSGPPMALLAGQPQWDDLADFVAFIEGLGLSHFTPDEFLYLGASNSSGGCAGKNSYPARNLWPNIKNTALMLDAIRAEMGAAIRILSCYRSPDYNSCIGGESASLHMKFNAIDFTCSAGTPEIWRRVADRLRSSNGAFKGGIGVYPSSRFVHIDTRGTNANWTG